MEPTDAVRPNVPLLEDDLDSAGVIGAARVVPRGATVPAIVVLCWFREVVDALAVRPDVEVAVELTSAAGPNPVYAVTHLGQRIGVVHPGMGAPFAAVVLEELVALGARQVLACGGAGALVPELVLGHAVVVDSAVRDEGTSYHYLAPERIVTADADVVAAITASLRADAVAHLVGRTWTTDAIFRETRARTARRVAEGCLTVEMEAAALMAVARMRGVGFGQVLMAGDTLAGEKWSSRGWTTADSARAEIFRATLQAAAALGR